MATNDKAFDVVLSDDFSAGYKVENWGHAFDGGTYWNGAFDWSKDDVAVRDGVLEVTNTRHGDGSWTAGGLNSFKAGKTITYGKIEFDGRVEEGQGTMGVFLTWPASDAWPVDGEIDILETPHSEQMFSTHYEGPDGQHWYDSKRGDTYDETQWNRYEVLWLPELLTVSVNGNEVARWTDPAQIPDVAHGIGAMGFVGAEHDAWIGGAPDASTPGVVRVQMDNVVMSQWNGGDPWSGADPVDPGTPPVEPAGPRVPAVLEAGTGPDALVLKVTQDAYQGDARYTVSVDGVQVGGEFTASTLQGSGAQDTLTLRGDWGPGAHEVEIAFTNDAFDTGADWSRPELVAADRNLFVEGATLNGQAVAGAELGIFNEWSANTFAFTEAAPADPDPVEPERPAEPSLVADIEGGDGADRLSVRLSGVSVDGRGGRDQIHLREGHEDVTVFVRAGEGGDKIHGFEGAGEAGGDVLQLMGFGADGVLMASGTGRFVALSADWETLAVFDLPGVKEIEAGDYLFV